MRKIIGEFIGGSLSGSNFILMARGRHATARSGRLTARRFLGGKTLSPAKIELSLLLLLLGLNWNVAQFFCFFGCLAGVMLPKKKKCVF